MNLGLFNLIVYHFASEAVHQVVLFHCWNESIQFNLAHVMAANSIFGQYISLKSNYTVVKQSERLDDILGIFVDLHCWRSEEVLRTLYFRHFQRFLVFGGAGYSVARFAELLASGTAQLSIDADLTYVEAHGELDSVFRLYDVYSNGEHLGGRINVTADREVGCSLRNCPDQRALTPLRERSKYGNRNDMSDVTLRMAAVSLTQPTSLSDEEKIAYLLTTENRQMDSIARFGFRMVMIMQELLRCNYSYTFFSSWSVSEIGGGIVGALVDHDADITSAPYLLNRNRLKHTRAIAGIHNFAEICFFRTSRYTVIRKTAFLKPFNSTVWLIIVACILVFALCLWVAFYSENFFLAAPRAPSILTTCLISIGSACVQSSYLLPQSTGGRFAYFSLSLITFLIYNYYTSIVVSSLLNDPAKSNVRTLLQLAESSMPVAFQNVPYTLSYLNTSKQPDVRLFVKRKMATQKSPFMPEEEGLRRVRDEPGFAYLIDMVGYLLIEHLFDDYQICDLNAVSLRPASVLYTHVNSNSTYEELFRLRYLRMLETGIYSKHRIYWVHEALRCYSRNYVITVGMEYTAPIFIMLATGYGFVLLLLAVEICVAVLKGKWADK